MKYKGQELTEFKSDKPVVFDPPKKMLVWDDDDMSCRYVVVLAYLPESTNPVIEERSFWQHCAEDPEELKPRRATNIELMKWLAQGNGQVSEDDCISVWMTHTYTKNKEHNACDKSTMVRKWDDKKWHEPTVDYMGIENDKENQ